MTIEEKAKRYDEAIQKANSIREGKCKNVFVYKDYNQKLIEYFFPELKESEDERIRKVIIQYLKDGTQYIPYRGYNLDECIAWLEKQGEQTPADKVEPKFHKGDWVVRDLNDRCYQIKDCIQNVTNNNYGYDLIGGGYISSQDANFYHLWTIQDANDGDVLYRPNSHEIFLFKETRDREYVDGCIEYHCVVVQYRDKNEFHINRIPGYAGTVDTTFYPATKEQRDLLFQKMKEAGYEWDAEKKELKKIHVIDEGKVKPQSSTPMSYGKELEARMHEACNRFDAPNTDPNRYSAADLFYAGVKAERDFNMHIKWSEEDEKQGEQKPKHFELQAGHWYICHRAFCCRADHLTVKEGERFMCEKDGVVKGFVCKEPEKYFKEVCAPAPMEDEQKPAWSEEDNYILNNIYDFVAENTIDKNKSGCAKECLSWLKLLKDRYTWKPSDEQMQALSNAGNSFRPFEKGHKVLWSLYNDLKKLKG